MDKKVLVQRLDRLTSVLVRMLEDRCATCGKKLLWKQRQAGHFVPRVVQKTRWDLGNVHVQCNKCNVELGGNIENYREFIASKLGEQTLSMYDFIYDAYKHGKLKAVTRNEMLEKYDEFLAAVRQLEKTPGELIPEDWQKYKK